LWIFVRKSKSLRHTSTTEQIPSKQCNWGCISSFDIFLSSDLNFLFNLQMQHSVVLWSKLMAKQLLEKWKRKNKLLTLM
jgi:hypothetical protein